MSDDQRVYSDEEFALILRTAAELASRAEQPGFSSNGLTLAEMKSAAAQAGLDPYDMSTTLAFPSSSMRTAPLDFCPLFASVPPTSTARMQDIPARSA